MRRVADREARRFLRENPDYTLADAAQGRSRFRNESDLEHWLGALQALGVKPHGEPRRGRAGGSSTERAPAPGCGRAVIAPWKVNGPAP